MKLTRRETLAASGMAIAGAAALGKRAFAQTGHEHHHPPEAPAKPEATPPAAPAARNGFKPPRGNEFYARTIDPDETVPPGEAGKDYMPTITPNGATLAFKIVDGVKVGHLVVEEVFHEFAAGLRAHLWGYNGRVHGPTIEAVEGDWVRIYVTNRLKAPTTIHWHGMIVPSGMDGVGGLSQKVIRPGETFKYEFKLIQHGTFMYHSHHDEMTQMAMGLMGLLVVHPRKPKHPRPDRDFAIMLSEWEIKPGTYRPDTAEFAGFNTLTMNARVFPGTVPLIAKLGDRVRIRLGNLSAMDHHPIHIHGHSFQITETDGGEVPPGGLWPETTVLVQVGATRTIEFVADNPGDWAFHCHMTHHIMNQMGHDFTNLIGVRTKDFTPQVQNLLPDYMSMGDAGMGEMGEHAQHMSMPQNSIPMLGSPGPHDYISMGGMFTILKVREELQSYDVHPGWYENPPGTQAALASKADLDRDGIPS